MDEPIIVFMEGMIMGMGMMISFFGIVLGEHILFLCGFFFIIVSLFISAVMV